MPNCRIDVPRTPDCQGYSQSRSPNPKPKAWTLSPQLFPPGVSGLRSRGGIRCHKGSGLRGWGLRFRGLGLGFRGVKVKRTRVKPSFCIDQVNDYVNFDFGSSMKTVAHCVCRCGLLLRVVGSGGFNWLSAVFALLGCVLVLVFGCSTCEGVPAACAWTRGGLAHPILVDHVASAVAVVRGDAERLIWSTQARTHQ